MLVVQNTKNKSVLPKESVELRVAIIGLFPWALEGEGPAGRVRGFASALHEAGAKVSVYVVSNDDSSHRWDWRGVTINSIARGVAYRAGKKNDWQDFWPISYFRKRALSGSMDLLRKKLQYDCEAGDMPEVVIFYNQDIHYALTIWLLCRRLGISFIQQYAERHKWDDYANGWRSTYYCSERLHYFVIPWIADGGIVISKLLKRHVDLVGARRALLVPLINTDSQYRETLSSSNDIWNLVCLSRGDRRDCLGMLLGAVLKIARTGIKIRLTIVGLAQSALTSYDIVIRREVACEVVRLRGFVANAELASVLSEAAGFILLRSADKSGAACLPSRVGEFFKYGVPVIMSRVGDMPDYFRDMRDAVFVGSEAELTDRLRLLVGNFQACADIGACGRETAQKCFSPLVIGRAMTRYCAEVRNSKRRPSIAEAKLH